MSTLRRARSLCIGINYRGTAHELQGCINDAEDSQRTFRNMATKAGLDFQSVLLTDDTKTIPTRTEIIRAMMWLINSARAGDVLYFHYSGHGSQTYDEDGDEEDGLDETIVAIDSRQITDDESKQLLCGTLPEGVTLYAIFDSCHSGTMLDLHCVWDEDTRTFIRDTYHACTRAKVYSLSGCLSIQTSMDLGSGAGIKRPVGALTSSLLPLMELGYSWADLVTETRRSLLRKGLDQVPQLETGRPQDALREVAFADLLPPSRAKAPVPAPGGPALPSVKSVRLHALQTGGTGPYTNDTDLFFVASLMSYAVMVNSPEMHSLPLDDADPSGAGAGGGNPFMDARLIPPPDDERCCGNCGLFDNVSLPCFDDDQGTDGDW